MVSLLPHRATFSWLWVSTLQLGGRRILKHDLGSGRRVVSFCDLELQELSQCNNAYVYSDLTAWGPPASPGFLSAPFSARIPLSPWNSMIETGNELPVK